MGSPRTQKKVARVYRREIRMMLKRPKPVVRVFWRYYVVVNLEGVRVRAPIPERLYRTLLAHGVEDGGDVKRWEPA